MLFSHEEFLSQKIMRAFLSLKTNATGRFDTFKMTISAAFAKAVTCVCFHGGRNKGCDVKRKSFFRRAAHFLTKQTSTASSFEFQKGFLKGQLAKFIRSQE